MATATLVQSPGDYVDYTPGADIDAGDIVVQGVLFGIATADIASGDLGAIAVGGVFDLPKDTGSTTAITAGAAVYWDAGSEVVTTTSSGNTRCGHAIAAAAAAAETVRVRLQSA